MRASSHAVSPLIGVLVSCALAASARAGPDWANTPPAGASPWAGAVQGNSVAALRCEESAPYQVYFGSQSICVGATSAFAVSLISTGAGHTSGIWGFQLVAPAPPAASWNPTGGDEDVWVRGPPTPHGTGCVESVFRGVQKITTDPSSKPSAPEISFVFASNVGNLPCTGFPP